jgi:DNA mismatch repair protein MutS2
VVALNNEIFELYNQEKVEIIKILKRLSANFRENKDALQINQECLIHIDVVQAEAQYSIEINGNAPQVSDTFAWNIRQGYHPLLLKKIGNDAIPLTLELSEKNRLIVITGPNAGGKTVALKTVGLLQLLFQCGFHIPVAEGSLFPLCSQLAAVIGDEQSIEDDLSTFSSHITKLNTIIKQQKYRSLILVDEIGTGTDPAEGSALAIALLEALNKSGTVTLVTTHLSELKAFAHRQENVVNAAMQFDFESLKPLFKLEVGVPGSSYAFDISQRLGMRENILKRARKLMGQAHDELQSMINDLTKKSQRYESKLKEISIRESELEGLKTLYQTHAAELKKKRKKYDGEARKEAQTILDNVNKTIEKVIREIKESQADSRIISKGRAAIQHLRENVQTDTDKKGEGKVIFKNLAIGQKVQSQRFGIEGEITKLLKDKKQVEIDANGLKLTIPLSDLSLQGETNINLTKNESTTVGNQQVINEIDLRGKLAEDAIIELDQYLDHALNSDWMEIRVIHGKGTGVLRTKVHSFLKKKKNIKTFRLGNYGEGDTGVTIIQLNKSPD